MNRSGRLLALVLAAGLPAVLWGQSARIAVVIGSESPPYQEALAGVRELVSEEILVFRVESFKIPDSVEVLITIGGKAALQTYPSGMVHIYCLSPGVIIEKHRLSHRHLKVYTVGSPGKTLDELVTLQPGLKRLGIPWISESQAQYIRDFREAAQSRNIDVVGEHFNSEEQLPDSLRYLKPHVDALWIPPDPAMINPGVFMTLREFSATERIPLYVPVEGLVEQGATAAVFSSFRESGKTAGAQALKTLKGELRSGEYVYPGSVNVLVNQKDSDLTRIPARLDTKKQGVIP